jgi:hypothetical protein
MIDRYDEIPRPPQDPSGPGSRPSASSGGAHPAPGGAPEPGPVLALRAARALCLVVPLGGDRLLARAAVELLRADFRHLSPTLEPLPGIRVLWACGYRPGAVPEVDRLRREHPAARLVVTGREVERDRAELFRLGVHRVLRWPVPLDALRVALTG